MNQALALIIDDNSQNLGVLAELLTLEGVNYILVQNPINLATILKTIQPVKVVFVDLEMPGLSGYDVLNMLKADTRFENVPVVAYTVHVSEINVARRLGFDSFLGKPLDAERFPDQLSRILKGEQVWVAV